jgi:iron complex outermembrane receptor protein
MNTERVGGYSTVGLNAGYRFDDFSTWFKKPFIKVNVFNALDHRAFINANNASAFLASNPNHITGVDGGSLFTSAPYYSLLEPRTFMITFGASFF